MKRDKSTRKKHNRYTKQKANNFSVLHKNTPKKIKKYFDGGVLHMLLGLMYLLKVYKKNVCLPSITRSAVPSMNTIALTWRCGVTQDTRDIGKNFVLGFPGGLESFKNKMVSCIRTNKRFIIIPLFLQLEDCDYTGHYNMIIFDKKEKIVERFEPYGINKSDFELLNIGKHFDTRFASILKTFTKQIKINFKYIPPSQTCPRIGVQEKEEADLNRSIKTPEHRLDPEGFCGVWSIWYAHLRLAYPNIPPNEIQKKALSILKKEPHSLRHFIRNYSAFLDTEKRRLVREVINEEELQAKFSRSNLTSNLNAINEETGLELKNYIVSRIIDRLV